MQNKADRGQQLGQWVGFLANIPIYCTEPAESKMFSETVVTLNHHSWFLRSLPNISICSHVGSKWEKGGFIMHAHIHVKKEARWCKFQTRSVLPKTGAELLQTKGPVVWPKFHFTGSILYSCDFLRRRLFGTGVAEGASGCSGFSGEGGRSGRLVEIFFNFLSRVQSSKSFDNYSHYHHFVYFVLFVATRWKRENNQDIL